MSVKSLRNLILLATVTLLLPAPAEAQSIGSSVSGRVVDAQGLGVPGAPVRILNTATNQVRTVSTDNDGRYEARELSPGLYNVTVEQSGFKTVTLQDVRLSVATNARLQLITLEPIPLEQSVTVTAGAEVALVDITTPTISTSFSDKQIRELPILSRDLNNLALLAPGVFSVRAFSFASTLVPFAANGSRGRDNNFIIDAVDNNEPLFGGAAAQFTNTDLFAEYRILTNQYKAEYGRNTGSVVNIITERGGNKWHGSLFWYGQHDNFNAATSAEKAAQLAGTTEFYENQFGMTFGGPIKKDKTWVFGSYQWDMARHDLSPLFPLVTTMPTAAGLTALNPFSGSLTVRQLLQNRTAATLASQGMPCGQATSGLPLTNPCTIGTAFANATTAVPFGTFLVPRAGVFDVHDHQGSFRVDHQLTPRDDFYVRYLFDDLVTPRTAGAFPAEVAFLDLGLFPEYRILFQQRTQNLGVYWTHAWPTALHELRLSASRIASRSGPAGVDEDTAENTPAITAVDNFAFNIAPGGTPQGTASLLASFPSAGQLFTLGRDSRPSRVRSNVFQLQDNISMTKGKHNIKLGGNFVWTRSDIRQASGDLGQYIYSAVRDVGTGTTLLTGFQNFVRNNPGITGSAGFQFTTLAYRRLMNVGGRGGDVLPLREFGQFYFIQDDYQAHPKVVFSFGLRYENYGQVINRVQEHNPVGFGAPVEHDVNNFAPRIGFAFSPDGKTAIRGGYGVYYNPTPFIIPLLAWQSGPISPLISIVGLDQFPTRPFIESDVSIPVSNCSPQGVLAVAGSTLGQCAASDTINKKLRNPYTQSYSLTVQRQFGRNWLIEVAYVGSKATKLYQRVDRNPQAGYNLVQTAVSPTCAAPPCLNLTAAGTVAERGRLNILRGGIFETNNGAASTYHALQVIGTKRLGRPRNDVAITAAYTWSHMIDNASEIFGPGVRLFNIFAGGNFNEVEAITPFAQNYANTTSAERGNSSFDRRHRLAVSFLWSLPSPSRKGANMLFGNWQVNGFFTLQSGQPFTPINGRSGGTCEDARGDGLPTNDRPDVGSVGAAMNTVALINNRFCVDPRDFASLPGAVVAQIRAGNQVGGATGPDYIDGNGNPTGAANARWVQVGLGRLGNAGRNILTGPRQTNLDVALFKNFPWGGEESRKSFQFRAEVYNATNTRNPGNPIGNVFSTTAQPVPGIAFLPLTATPSRVIGTIPENALDASDAVTGNSLFLSRQFMNTSSRKFQFAVKLLW
jgi:hypothetical protein